MKREERQAHKRDIIAFARPKILYSLLSFISKISGGISNVQQTELYSSNTLLSNN